MKIGPYDADSIYLGDCMEMMQHIPDSSIDLVVCDPPYGMTSMPWDRRLDMPKLFEHYRRIVKQSGPIVLFSTQPFTTDIISLGRDMFRYEWIWCKNQPSGGMQVKHRPLKQHENLVVFYREQPTYNPHKRARTKLELSRFSYESVDTESNHMPSLSVRSPNRFDRTMRFPDSLLFFDGVASRSYEKTGHPTEKPVNLIRYLILTYTSPGDIVLDNCMGSGTTAIAAMRSDRRFLGFELDEEFYDMADMRIDRERRKVNGAT